MPGRKCRRCGVKYPFQEVRLDAAKGYVCVSCLRVESEKNREKIAAAEHVRAERRAEKIEANKERWTKIGNWVRSKLSR